MSVVLALSLLAMIVDKGLQKTEAENYAEWNAIKDGGINADLLILGSSRAWVHVAPFILDTALHLNSFNLGLDGHHFETQVARYDFYKEFNRRPQYIVHCIDLQMLTRRKELYMVEQFAPYLRDQNLQSTLKKHIGFSQLDYLTPFTKYQYKYRYIAIGLLEFLNVKHFKTNKYKGYLGKEQEWDQSFEAVRQRRPSGWSLTLEEELIEHFKSYLQECSENGITIVLVYTPEYIEAQRLLKNRGELMSFYQATAERYNAKFLDYSGDELCYDTAFFYNSQHLNKKGSEIFTAKLAADLKQIFSQQGK